MNQDKGMVQMHDIASRQNISLKYLEQLIIPIKNAGLVISKRGPKGGHRLNRTPDRITMGEVIRAFEKKTPPPEVSGSISDNWAHQDSAVRDAWDEAIEVFFNKLEKKTLADLSIETIKKKIENSTLIVFM